MVSVWHIIPAPDPAPAIRFTGQPILMSMVSTPCSCRNRAASSMWSGSLPKICTANGLSRACVSIICIVRSLRANRARQLTRSVVASPTPPSVRTITRNGRVVNPASGESRYRESNCSVPQEIGPRNLGRGICFSFPREAPDAERNTVGIALLMDFLRRRPEEVMPNIRLF